MTDLSEGGGMGGSKKWEKGIIWKWGVDTPLETMI